MTMGNPYGPEALASTMAPQQSTMPLVLAPENLAQGMQAGQQAPTLTQPGPVGPMGIPPPTVADPAALQASAQTAAMPPPIPVGVPPPPPVAAGAPPPALPNASVSPDANMTSATTGAPATAAPPMASDGTVPPPPGQEPGAPNAPTEEGAPAEPAPAKPAGPPKSMKAAGVVNPALQQVGSLNRTIGTLNEAKNIEESGYAERTAKRGEEIEDLANDIALKRTVQNTTDAYHANQLRDFDNKATEQTGKEMADIQRVAKEVGAMKVDPKAALPKGVMGSIFGALGAALGGAASALTGGPNQFMAIVNHAVDTQMRADEANIAKAKEGLGTKISLYGMMRGQLGDDRQAKLAYRKAAWDYAENEVNKLKDKTSDVGQKQKWDGLTMAIDKERINDQLNYATNRKQELVGAMTADEAARRKAQQQAFDNWIKERETKAAELKAAAESKKGGFEVAKEERAKNATFIRGLGGYIANETAAKEINGAVNSINNTLSAIARVRHLIDAGGRTNPRKQGALRQAISALAISEKDRNQLGQLTGGDWDTMALKPEDAALIFTGEREGALDELENFVKTQRTNLRNNYIITNADGRPNMDSTGAVYIPNSLEQTGKK